jgi:hypothetical protein
MSDKRAEDADRSVAAAATPAPAAAAAAQPKPPLNGKRRRFALLGIGAAMLLGISPLIHPWGRRGSAQAAMTSSNAVSTRIS